MVHSERHSSCSDSDGSIDGRASAPDSISVADVAEEEASSEDEGETVAPEATLSWVGRRRESMRVRAQTVGTLLRRASFGGPASFGRRASKRMSSGGALAVCTDTPRHAEAYHEGVGLWKPLLKGPR